MEEEEGKRRRENLFERQLDEEIDSLIGSGSDEQCSRLYYYECMQSPSIRINLTC